MYSLTTCIVLFLLNIGFFSAQLKVESTAFAYKHYIPYRYTCDGDNINPELRITNIPATAKSLALILLDTTAAFGVFDHWVVWNIPPSGKIPEKSEPGITGRNSNKENKYKGPCPPNGIHEYHFRVYALDALLSLQDTTGKEGLLKAMQGHILSKGELIALFRRE